MRRAEPGRARRHRPIAGVLLSDGVGVTGVRCIALGLLALAVPVVTLTTRGPAKSIGIAVLASAFELDRHVLALIRVLGDSSTGAWLALAGAVLAWVGSWLSMRDESTRAAAPTSSGGALPRPDAALAIAVPSCRSWPRARRSRSASRSSRA